MTATTMAYTPTERKQYAQRFALWVGMGSIFMMFAGFTSAYLVKRADARFWTDFSIPPVFYVSTLLIILSSLTLWKASSLFKRNDIAGYKNWLGITLLLGLGFLGAQCWGWFEIYNAGIFLNTTISGSFFYVISGAHAAHVLAGIIVLLVSYIGVTRKMQDPVYDLTMEVSPGRKFNVSLVASFWHFLDALWIYLFIFLLINHL